MSKGRREVLKAWAVMQLLILILAAFAALMGSQLAGLKILCIFSLGDIVICTAVFLSEP